MNDEDYYNIGKVALSALGITPGRQAGITHAGRKIAHYVLALRVGTIPPEYTEARSQLELMARTSLVEDEREACIRALTEIDRLTTLIGDKDDQIIILSDEVTRLSHLVVDARESLTLAARDLVKLARAYLPKTILQTRNLP
jgi:hypothetical protein